MLADYPFIRQVASPLTPAMVAPLDERCRVVQFSSLLSDEDFARVAELLRRHPDVSLRVYGSYDGSITDLEFLRFFPSLRRFQADAMYRSLQSLDGLRHLREDLDSLGIGQTKTRLPLDGLARFAELRQLSLEGQTKGIEVISGLTHLEDLTLRSIALSDLSLLRPLDNLRALGLKLGGTKNLADLPSIGRIEYLELWMIRGFEDLTPVAEILTLRYLFLQALKNVRQLPSLHKLGKLRGVHLETMKGLSDLTALTSAPALEQLALLDMGHLSPDDLTCLVGHPSLRKVLLGLGSTSKNDRARKLIGLPGFTYDKAAWREGERARAPS